MSDQWEQISDLYHEALKLPEEERAAYLKEHATNEDVRQEVESLLANEQSGALLMQSPALEVAARMMAERNPILENGQILGHYQITRQIGEGGMGEVYQAKDLKLGRDVAIKVLPEEFARNADRVDRFRREAKVLAALNHPNIITIHDISHSAGVEFIVMEYVEGRTLNRLIGTSELALERILEYATQITSALGAAHAAGIVHRDLKPTNIMVNDKGTVKVLDFGLARLTARRLENALATTQTMLDVTRQGVILGTAAYMSPEQAEGIPVDVRSDVFSFGSILLEMLTGQRAFQGESFSSTISAILRDTPVSVRKLRGDVPASLEQIVNRCLEKDREARYGSGAEVWKELTIVQSQLAMRRVGSGHILRKPHFVIPVLALLVAIAAMIGWYWTHNSRGFQSRTVASPEIERLVDATDIKVPLHLPSLAVLAFTNMSADRENEYFCDGLSEEIINALSNIRDLRVAARTSAFAFKGKEVDIRTVGEKLNVGTVLEGSVRKSGQRLRITAQLINVEDGYHIWSGQFDREMKDIFDIQEEISLSIVDQLKLSLLKGEKEKILKRHTEDPEAYELYLKGLHFWRRRYEKGLQKSLQYFQLAAEKDPGYALPHVGIADAFGILGVYAFMPPDLAYSRARAAANKALEIDPELAEVHASLGWISMWYDRDWPAAETHFKKAIRMKPDYPEAHLWYGNLLACLGRADKSIQEMRKGTELEPLEPAPPTHVGWALYFAQRFDESIEILREVVASDPEFPLPYSTLSGDFMAKKMWSEAIEASQKFVELSAGSVFSLSILGAAYGSAGMKDEALRILDQLDGLSKDRYVGPFFRALVWTGLGEKDKALENLEKAYEGRESFMAWIKVWPGINNLRSEPRFQALLTKMNLDK